MNTLYESLATITFLSLMIIVLGACYYFYLGLEKLLLLRRDWQAGREFKRMRRNLDRATPAK